MVNNVNINQLKPQDKTDDIEGIGIFGGTFDPIHLGHTKLAKSVASWLNLSKVLFIPAHIPPHKNEINTTPSANAKQRSTMVELACKDSLLFQCDGRELEREQTSYTIDTLIELKEKYPNQTLYFIVGMDSLLTFTTWHRYQDILNFCHLVVNTRPTYDLLQINESTKALLHKHQVNSLEALNQSRHGKIIFSKPIFIDISSTQIRHNLKVNKNLQQQLSPTVIDFININQLYR